MSNAAFANTIFPFRIKKIFFCAIFFAALLLYTSPIPRDTATTSQLSQAFPQCVFDHWAMFPGDPLAETGLASEIRQKIRTRKGLKPEVPPLENFYDKL